MEYFVVLLRLREEFLRPRECLFDSVDSEVSILGEETFATNGEETEFEGGRWQNMPILPERRNLLPSVGSFGSLYVVVGTYCSFQLLSILAVYQQAQIHCQLHLLFSY